MQLRGVFSLVFLVLSQSLFGQESNYSVYEVGANSSMLAGAVTAGVVDNSAIYYNPGALGFIENSNLSIETASLFGGLLRIRNGAGTDLDVKSSFFDVVPSLLAGTIKSKKDTSMTYAYAFMTTNSAFLKTQIRNLMEYDVIPSLPGPEQYDGVYEYSNRIRENWVGAAVNKLFSEKLSVGASLFGVYHSQDFAFRQEANVSLPGFDTTRTVGFSRVQRDMEFSSISLVGQVGFVYRSGNSRFGMNITLPNWNINVIADGELSEAVNIFMPTAGQEFASQNHFGKDLKTTHKIPLSVALGYNIKTPTFGWHFRATFYDGVDTYTRIETDRQSDFYSGNPVVVEGRADPIVNLAVGVRKDIREGLIFLGGLRTDFNYNPNVDPSGLGFSDRLAYWDLYHLSGGVIWHNDRAYLTLGADYGMGWSRGDKQLINLTEPTEANFLFGERTNDTRTYYGQLNVVLGFALTFIDND